MTLIRLHFFDMMPVSFWCTKSYIHTWPAAIAMFYKSCIYYISSHLCIQYARNFPNIAQGMN